MHIANYLTKSRHGIWYYRWAVPLRIRTAHPSLPKELKRSTKTADIRLARVRARKFHESLALPFMNADDLSNLLADAQRQQFMLERDPVTGRVVRIQAEPHEWQAAFAATRQIEELMTAVIQSHSQEHPTKARIAASSTPLISAAFEKYAQEQIELSLWSENTRKHTHEPSIALFRELVGESQTAELDGAPRFDLALSELTRERMGTFVETFRSFPVRQGKRYANAREALAEGGPRQSLDNYFKRLEHVHQFIRYCVGKSWVSEEVAAELQQVLKRNNTRSRQAEAKKRVAQGGSEDDGYVSFSKDDLEKIFGPGFCAHVAARKGEIRTTDELARATYRYWTPVIALFTGMRVAEISQLHVDDFIVAEGIHCFDITEGRTDKATGIVTRLKTKAAKRKIPIHPRLIELGLLVHVERNRLAGKTWLWDGLLWTEKSGFGKYPGRDFQLLTESVGVYVKRRKVFHSFRSTIQQALERASLEGHLIDHFIGHDVPDTRSKHYARADGGRAVPYQRVHDALSRVSFDIDLPHLGKILAP